MSRWGGRGFFALVLAGGFGLLPTVAHAQPQMQEETDTVDDATTTLRVRTAGIIDDPLFWCEVAIDVVGDAVPFTEGDTVQVDFVEDDAFINDLIWTTTHTITAATIHAIRQLDASMTTLSSTGAW